MKYGLPGGTCDTNTVTATRTFILVNGVSEYQWKAQITGLAADTQYCYRVYFGSAQLDLLGTDASPVFRTQIPAGSTAPFKFAVWGNWGKTLAAGNPNQANLISQIAQSGSRFAVTTGDNAYEVGSQKSYGDLYQVGDNTSAVFGPNYWKVAGASLPDLPRDRQPRPQQQRHAHELAAGHGRRHRPAASYQTDRPTAARTAPPRPTIRTAGTRSTPGWRASTCSKRRGRTRTWAPPTCSRTTSTTTGGPTRRSTSGSRTTSRPIPARVRFAFHHFPLYSDQSATSSDTYLQGAGSLEGLLKLHDVTVDFNAHSHNYQRNSVPAGRRADVRERRRRREPGVDRQLHSRLQRERPLRARLVEHVQRRQRVRRRRRSRPPRTACTTSCS